MLVQPTISHFIKNTSKSQPVPKPKQEITEAVSYSPPQEDDTLKEFNLPIDVHATVAVSTRDDIKKRTNKLDLNRDLPSAENDSKSSNPFAKDLPKRQSTVAAGNDFTAKEGLPFNQRGGHKSLSLKVRKRKHRTLSISPPNSAESCRTSKKICRSRENETVQLDSTVLQNIERSGLEHCEKLQDRTTIKAGNDGNVLCRFSNEEEDLMASYALDSNQSNTRELSLADLDRNRQLSSVNSSVGNLASENHHITRLNKSSVPCSPAFSPKRPTPKAFSPFLEKTSVARDYGLLTSHDQVSVSNRQLDSSTILFSTPTDSPHAIPTASPSLSRSTPRRVLNFATARESGSISPTSSVLQVNETFLPSRVALPPAVNHSASSGSDLSFINDISLSEFADISHVETGEENSLPHPSKKPLGLNRHLVLEVTSQECTSNDALLCTGRYSVTLS